MKASRFFVLLLTRAGVPIAALLLSLSGASVSVLAQDVGVDVGGGAGIFRPKNPEIKKRTVRTTPVRRGTRTTTATTASVDDKIEDLLEKGNQFRDARRFAEAEAAYQSIFKLRPNSGRAAYGLGNIYSDQQRWEDAEAAYRNAAQWSPSDLDVLVALSVVLVQPRTGGAMRNVLLTPKAFARRAVQLAPKNAIAWDRLGVALEARGLCNSETENAYRRAVELDPQGPSPMRIWRTCSIACIGLLMRRRFTNSHAIAKDPPTLNLLCRSLQEDQQWQNSEPVLKRALELDARNPTALYLMGRMLVVLKRYQESESYLKLATEVSPRAFARSIFSVEPISRWVALKKRK